MSVGFWCVGGISAIRAQYVKPSTVVTQFGHSLARAGRAGQPGVFHPVIGRRWPAALLLGPLMADATQS